MFPRPLSPLELNTPRLLLLEQTQNLADAAFRQATETGTPTSSATSTESGAGPGARDTAKHMLDCLAVATRSRTTSPSLAPVGFDLDPPMSATRVFRLVERRRELSRYVIGAMAVACAILLAAAVRPSGKGDDSSSASAARHDEPVVVAETATHAAADAPSHNATTRSAAVAAARRSSRAATDVASSGLIRFTTQPGWAWVDGQQLSATSALVACGTHRVQIGGAPARDVDVPCGGEVVVSR